MHMKNIDEWIIRQESFSEECRLLRDSLLNTWGCYDYDISVQTLTSGTEIVDNKFPIWQLFYQSYCTEINIDYSRYPSVQRDLNPLYNRVFQYSRSVYDQIYEFINKLKNNGEDITCVIGDSDLEIDSQVDKFNKFHFGYLCEKLIANNIVSESDIISINDFYSFIDADCDDPAIGSTVIYLELISENESIYNVCHDIAIQGAFLRKIIPISILKEFDRDEILAILKEEEKQELRFITDQVKNWENLFIFLKYSYQYNYYPTTCGFKATDYEWSIRKLIWNFKNDPEQKTTEYDHRVAMNKVIKELEYKLKKDFGNYVSKLTFVCIPASTKIKNEARYKEFSNIICGKLNMKNAYSFITLNQDRMAKHLGGYDINNLIFDEAFFNEKNIILFDDVVTKGKSMLDFYQKMTSLGANVICAMSIGKTKHERDIEHLSWSSD